MSQLLKPALVDAAVAIVFFNRDDSLRDVFARVREARPSQLFLIQDGARAARESDPQDMESCRKIFDDIDWECTVHKNFAEENMGCGRRVSSGISWVFEHTDRAIILEDDCIIEPTFIRFAAELLEKYKDDTRVTMISALNHFEEWDCAPYSYFFTHTGAIAAWATWKRVWDQFDFSVSDIENTYDQKLLTESFHHKYAARARMAVWKSVNEKAKAGEPIRYWGEQFGYLKYKLGGLCIVPSHSLSSNVGVNSKATFSGSGLEFMYKPMRQWFFQKTRPMEFPLVHPNVFQTDVDYDQLYYSTTYKNTFQKFCIKGYYYCKRKVYKVIHH